MNKNMDELEQFLSTLPSISKKNAKKITMLLATNKEVNNELKDNLSKIDDIHKCPYCNNLTVDKYCHWCLDNKQRSVIIINSFNDLINLEKIDTESYQKFILDNDGRIDLDKLDLTQLNTFLDRSNLEEVIIFISPTVEGKILTEKIVNLCKFKKIKTTKLRIGVPFGAAIETVDSITLKESLNKREDT